MGTFRSSSVSFCLAMALASGSAILRGQPRLGSAEAATQAIERKWKDLPYASLSQAQKLDIYLPNQPGGPYPVVLQIHGGAFRMGDKGDGQLVPVLGALKRGYAVVAINYRLSGEARFPAQIQDVKAAIRWIRAHAKTYQLDSSRIAIWGGSAGGYLAALAGTSGGVAALEDLSLGSPEQSSRVQAVVDWFGPIDFLTMDPQLKASGNGKADHSESDSPESRLLGAKITDVPDKVRLASPATYISAEDPPFLIQHGDKDHLVPTEQSIVFAAQLKKALGKDKVCLEVLPGARHGGSAFDSPVTVNQVMDFLDKYLKP